MKKENIVGYKIETHLIALHLSQNLPGFVQSGRSQLKGILVIHPGYVLADLLVECKSDLVPLVVYLCFIYNNSIASH